MNRTYSKFLFFVVSLAPALMLVFGCSSSDNGTRPKPFDVEANLAKGWNLFGSSDYQDGLDVFYDVLEHSENHPEAFLGKGWCFAFAGDLDSAIVALRAAIEFNDHGLYYIDANMGLAAVIRDCLDYPDNFKEAIDRAQAVIDEDADYVFSKRTTIDYKDAYLIVGQCQFRRGSSYFRYAHTAVNYLCGLEGLELLPDAASLPADEYEHLMAEKLEKLTELIGD